MWFGFQAKRRANYTLLAFLDKYVTIVFALSLQKGSQYQQSD